MFLITIDHYGSSCIICGYNFENQFGPVGQGYIHVHHVVPLANVNAEYVVDPIKDLRPVCPNCHAMLHKSDLSIDDLGAILEYRTQKHA